MKYFIIAGEASGDLHAANLMRELKLKDAKAEFCFLGGDLMQAQGGTLIRHYRQMAFMGIVPVLLNYRTIMQIMESCKTALLQFQPDLLILVDYPGFNLRMAKFAKENLQCQVHYYIPPKIWVWKEHRIKQIKKYIDKVFTIFPFETAFYAKHNYKSDYVGNPSVDSVFLRPNQNQTLDEFCKKNQLPNRPIIALLSGSRKQEISKCLPKMIAAASKLTDYQIIIAGAPGIDPQFYHSFIQTQKVSIVFDQTYDLVQQASAAVVNSGTATLETALLGTPQVVVYHVAFPRFSYTFQGLVMKVNFFSLVNLIATKEVVKELLFHFFTVENVAKELEQLLHNKEYRLKMVNEYAKIKNILGEPNTAKHAAEKMIACL